MNQPLTEQQFPFQRSWSRKFIGRVWIGYFLALLLTLYPRFNYLPHLSRFSYALAMTVFAVGLTLLFWLVPSTQHFSFENEAFVFFVTLFGRRIGSGWRLPYGNLKNVSVFQTASDKRQHLASLVLENNQQLVFDTLTIPGISNNPQFRQIAGTGPWNNLFVIDGLREEDAAKLCAVVTEKLHHP